MLTIPESKKKLIEKLYYQKGLSGPKIARELDYTLDQVYAFMRKYKLKRRSAIEDNALRFERKPLSYSVKQHLTDEEQQLKLLGITLYWGEGYKAISSKSIDFANSDPDMIRIFTTFLRDICRVHSERIRAYIYCFPDQDTLELIRFWSTLTNIPPEQFTKPYIRKDAKGRNSGRMPYGLLHVRYADKKLLDQMRTWIKEIKETY